MAQAHADSETRLATAACAAGSPPSTVSAAPGDDDQAYLDRVFEQMVALVEDGRPADQLDLDAAHQHLLPRLDDLIRLAHAVADGRPPVLPTIPGYRILGELGHGGMGAVYLAQQERVGGRAVALKLLPPAVAQSPQARARFRAEALAIARLHHANIVAIHDIIEEAGIYAYAMEWIDGPSLAGLIDHLSGLGREPTMDDVAAQLGLRDRPESGSVPRFLARIGGQLAEALETVHGARLLHRDVKPSNVLLRRDGTALLSDFGLARTADSTLMTMSGCFIGTPAYASPEQLRGEQDRVDARSDVYSLGATLYNALARRVPFPSQSTGQILKQIEEGRLTPLRRVSPRVPRDLATIVTKAMAPEPERRYPSAGALRDELKRFLADEPITARQASLVYRLRKRVRRHRVVASLALVALLLAISLPLAWVGGLRRALQSTRSAPFGHIDRDGRAVAYEIQRLQSSDAVPTDFFAGAVAVHGDTAVIAASNDRSRAEAAGAAYLYRNDGVSWMQQQQLWPHPPGPAGGPHFGWSASIDGDIMLVGAPGAELALGPSDGVYVFRLTADGWVYQTTLRPDPPTQGCTVGISVDVCGSLAVLGAAAGAETMNADPPSVWVFQCDDAGTPDEPLDDVWRQIARLELPPQPGGWFTYVALDNTSIGVGTPGSNSGVPGAAYLFERQSSDSTAWAISATLLASDSAPGDSYGCSIDVDGDRVAIGAMASSSPELDSGSAYVFRRTGDQWRQEAKLVPSGAGVRSRVGQTVKLRGDLLLVSAHCDSGAAYMSGAVYLYRYDGTAWVEDTKLRPANPTALANFGNALDFDGDTAVVGAPHPDPSGIGEAFIFRGLSDCNANGVLDLRDRIAGTGRDGNRNGVLDECEPFPLRLTRNTSPAPDEVLIGPPDDLFVELRTATVEYDFGIRRIVDRPGPDFNIYESETGPVELDLVDVYVSEDGATFVPVVSWANSPLRIPGDGQRHLSPYVRSYDLAGTGLARVRYVRIIGRDDGRDGLDLDAIGAIHLTQDAPGADRQGANRGSAISDRPRATHGKRKSPCFSDLRIFWDFRENSRRSDARAPLIGGWECAGST